MSKKEILAQEDLEITAATAGTAPVQLPGQVISLFPAFAHRNYQLYFIGQGISLLGFWLQVVGSGWLVFQLTHSAFWVGAVAAVWSLPFLFFTTLAGVFIDRLNKQKLLIITQIFEAIFACLLGLLVLTGNITLPLVITLAFLHGTVGSIDLPARFSFIVEMVGKGDLASAVSLNIGEFNAARFIGPSIAGVVIALLGVGWAFIFNGISFLPGIWVVAIIRPVLTPQKDDHSHPFKSLVEGLKYVFASKKIFYFTILAAVSAIFIWPYQTLMPIISENVYQAGAAGLGSLLSAAGAGSFAGAIFTSSQTRKKDKTIFIVLGVAISAISLILFALNRNFALAHTLLFIAGFGIIMLASTLNTLVQLESPDRMRARIMGVYLTMFVGMIPIGNALVGVIAQKTSSLFAIGLGAAIVLAVGVLLYLRGFFSDLS